MEGKGCGIVFFSFSHFKNISFAMCTHYLACLWSARQTSPWEQSRRGCSAFKVTAIQGDRFSVCFKGISSPLILRCCSWPRWAPAQREPPSSPHPGLTIPASGMSQRI